MMNPKQLKEPAPDASPEEVAEFYETHSTVDMEPGEPVEIQVDPDYKVSYSVRLNQATRNGLEAAARRAGVGITQLMRQWLEERLEAEQDEAETLTIRLRHAGTRWVVSQARDRA